MKFRQFNTLKYTLHRQQGVILIVSLIMLLVMTLIGVGLSTGSILQERLAGNTRQASLARLNAESALREAEDSLFLLLDGAPSVSPAIANAFNAAGDPLRVSVNRSGFNFEPLVNGALLTAEILTDADFWADNPTLSVTATAAEKISNEGRVQTPPRYMIEYIGLLPLNQPASGIDVSIEVRNSVSQIPHAFRITAIGYGQNERIYSVLQSVYSTDK